MSPVIALDIGGTRCRAALVEAGRIGWRAECRTPGQAGPLALIDAVAELLAALADVEAPVGAAIAAVVVDGRVTAHNEEVLRGWQDFALQQVLADRLRRPVRVLNDARAAAWAEYRFGAGRGCSQFVFVTVSTGIGAGLVLDGRLHLAPDGFDAELGETLLSDGRRLEACASGSALDARAQTLGHADGPALCDAADRGDAAAENALREGIAALAHKLADLRVLLGIRRCAVGGGLGLRPGYLARLREEVDRLPPIYRLELLAAECGADAGLLGAAALAVQAPDHADAR